MSDKTVLAGSLGFLGLGDVMQILGGNSSTGVLRIISRYAPEPGFIYFRDGNPIDASCGSKTGLDAVYSLFGWTDGEFEFTQEEVTLETVITKSRMGIILEGLKMVDDGQIERIGPDTAATRQMASSRDGTAVPVIKGPLVDYMYVADEEDFFDGENIVEEGKHGSWIWVILEGVVEIVKETPKGPLPLVRLADGCFIGSLSTFLIQGHIRTATAVAVGNVQLGVLDAQRLSQEFAALSSDFRNLLIGLDRRLVQLNERIAEYFHSTVDADRFIDNRTPMIRQGDAEPALYQIADGDAVVVRHHEKGRVPLVHLQRGDFFGNIGFLDIGQEPEFASVLTSKDVKVNKADTVKFKSEYEKLSPTMKNMVDHLATCLTITTGVVCSRQAATKP